MRDIDLSKPGAAQQVSDMLTKQVKRTMLEAVTVCSRELAVFTPVRTGRLRWGYFCTVNAPSGEVPQEGEYQFPDIGSRIKGLDSFTVSDTLYITNNVPYGPGLNDGTAHTPPRHFVERAVASTKIAISAQRKPGGRK